MGSTQSVSGTPARPLPRNKHVARVADPRSPSAGIQRTPIQVESSPQPSLPAEQLNSLRQAQDPDPRSPTLGIARTPMKISGPDPPCSLVKELSEVFETEASESASSPELALPQETPLSPERDLPSDPQLSLEVQLLSWSHTEPDSKQEEAKQSTETIVANQNSDKASRDPETPQSSGSKHSRRKAKSKLLGRSPLTVLQDDNSPGTVTLRQGKRPSALSENVKDLKDGAILGTGRFPKAGGGAWEQSQDHDKENQHFALMES
ncbi:cell division cycle-associated protein 3 [Apodemus sylvaticus]|uniref:cell division cycle-associated protein 3 n=1 Tax=Apodemus sylvaticus TaxID=10129 RepID=UPI0022444787|nr:cell division cycle-associated protein 3 [Apodemus sylvaticus]XP_052030804.1 cell division cycle-associated protein 3 [Apodemus sylvaticus]